MIKANPKHGAADVYGCQHKDGVDACAESNCCTYLNRNKMRRKRLITIAATNIGIFTLLVIYTLLGACIFMSIEGGAMIAAQKSLSSSTLYQQQAKTKLAERTMYHFNATVTQASALLRSQAVENIWEITVSLNILYKDNWTRLAAQEISRFEDQLIQRMTSEMSSHYNVAGKALQVSGRERVEVNSIDEHDWSFAKAFLYSLTVLTTIGYGRVTPRTGLGKVVTIGYAVIGIPLTLLYLSIVGSVLSKIARSVCFRTICCCLCSKCSYCCYIKPWEGEKEKINKNNRQDITEITNRTMQEPYYVRSPSGTIISASQAHRASTNPTNEKSFSFMGHCDSSGHGGSKKPKNLSILAPVLLCLCIIFAYILFGAFILYNLENLSPIDGVYFCFMSLSTIGFSSLVSNPGIYQNKINSNSTVWFCSLYIMTGLALTAMCFNVLHDEIVYRLKHSETSTKPSMDHKVPATEYLHQS